MNFLKLGWRAPRQNQYTGPDAVPLRNTFEDLQRFLTVPYIGLRFDGTFSVPTSPITPIPFTPFSSAASPFVAGDPYSLWRSATNTIQVPFDFDTWMMHGSALVNTTGGTAASVLSFGWLINGANNDWISHWTGNPGSRGIQSIIRPVRAGDAVAVAAATTEAAEDITDSEAWIYFLPLG